VSPKQLADSRRQAMRLRARRIRQGVAGLALALFSAAFLTVYVQLASGHDPALVAATNRRVSSASRVTTSTAAEPSAAESGELSGGESLSPSEETSAGEEPGSLEGPASVTSRQS
jgi:hypothetical protein